MAQRERLAQEGALLMHAEFVQQREGVRVGAYEDVLAAVEHVAASQRHTARAATSAARGFVDGDGAARLHCAHGRRQPGPACTNDGDVLCAGRAAHVFVEY